MIQKKSEITITPAGPAMKMVDHHTDIAFAVYQPGERKVKRLRIFFAQFVKHFNHIIRFILLIDI